MNDFNLFEFVKMLEKTCLCSGVINSFFESRYSLNSSDNVNYPVISFTVNTITKNEGFLNIDCNILYADRLTNDRYNRLSIQSTGVNFLSELINSISDNLSIDVQSPSMSVFSEQFSDNCAGVVSRQTFVVPSAIANCYDLIPKCCYDE